MSTSNHKFHEVRRVLGLTQAEMGSVLDVHCITIRNWEKGEPRLNCEHRRILEKEIGINPIYILCPEQHVDMLMPRVKVEKARETAQKLLAAEMGGAK